MKYQIFFLVLLFLGHHEIEGKSDEKSSPAFVIDDTYSMSDDIHEVKHGANAIFNTVMTSNSSQIEDIVLVTSNNSATPMTTTAKTGTTSIVVGSKPHFIYNNGDLNDIHFTYFGTAVMDCRIYEEPAPKVKWVHDGKSMDYSELVYEFEMKSDSDKGLYTCIVSNEFGSSQQQFNVNVHRCALDIKTDFNDNAPLMVTPYLELPKFEVTDGHVNIPKDENIVLYCPAGFTKMPREQKIMVTCENGKTFSYGSKRYSYADLKCSRKIEVTLKRTGPCNNGKSIFIDIGFEIKLRRGSKFIQVFQVCLNVTSMRTYYTKLNMQPTLANVLPDYGFHNLTRDYTILNCDHQNNRVSNILAMDFHTRDGCCFAKKQLVNSRDVAPGLSQIATYMFSNAVPHWSTCNSLNWDDVEQRIRTLVVSANHPLQVWTGTAQNLQLPDAGSSLKNITLPTGGEEQQVPKYIWKVVQDPVNNASLAIIHVNIPDLMQRDARSYMLCSDVCSAIDWMRGRRWRNVNRGFTYCCRLSDFVRVFGYSGEFPMHDELLSEA